MFYTKPSETRTLISSKKKKITLYLNTILILHFSQNLMLKKINIVSQNDFFFLDSLFVNLFYVNPRKRFIVKLQYRSDVIIDFDTFMLSSFVFTRRPVLYIYYSAYYSGPRQVYINIKCNLLVSMILEYDPLRLHYFKAINNRYSYCACACDKNES